MDRLDEKILTELRQEGSLTSAKLGERVGLSPSATHRRVRSLEERGLIRGYRARLSRQARGNPSIVFTSVTLRDQRQDSLSRFEDSLRRHSSITEAHLMSGDADYLLKVEVPEGESYEGIHRDVLSVLPGVHRLVSHFSIRAVLEEE